MIPKIFQYLKFAAESQLKQIKYYCIHLKTGSFSLKELIPFPVPGFLSIFIDSTSSTFPPIFFDFSNLQYEFFGEGLFFKYFSVELFFWILPDSIDPTGFFAPTPVALFGMAGLLGGEYFFVSCLGDWFLPASNQFPLLLTLLEFLVVEPGDLLFILACSTTFLVDILFSSQTFFFCSTAIILTSSISVCSLLNYLSFQQTFWHNNLIFSLQCFSIVIQFFSNNEIFSFNCKISSFSSTCLVSILELSSSSSVFAYELSLSW